jgi:hypothetical protein
MPQLLESSNKSSAVLSVFSERVFWRLYLAGGRLRANSRELLLAKTGRCYLPEKATSVRCQASGPAAEKLSLVAGSAVLKNVKKPKSKA